MVTLLLVGGQLPPLTQLRTGPAQIDTRTKLDGDGYLFLGSDRPIWNDDRDTAILVDPYNFVVSRYRY